MFPYKDYKDLFPTQEAQEAYILAQGILKNDLVDKALQEKLKEDPFYEVFLPLYYYRALHKTKPKTPVLQTGLHWISNRGTLIRKKKDEYNVVSTYMGSSNYPQHTMSFGNEYHTIAIHRAVACVFTPVPMDLFSKHTMHELEANHKDGIKTNPKSTNMEWATPKTNAKHAIENGLKLTGLNHGQTKPHKAKVIRGEFIGYEFIVFGKTQLKQYGFDQAAVSNAVSGNILSHGNCEWSFATIEEQQNLPNGPSEEVLKSLKTINPWESVKYIGTCLKTGNIVEAVGKQALIALGFNPNAVGNCVRGAVKASGGHSWKSVKIA